MRLPILTINSNRGRIAHRLRDFSRVEMKIAIFAHCILRKTESAACVRRPVSIMRVENYYTPTSVKLISRSKPDRISEHRLVLKNRLMGLAGTTQ